MTNREANDKTNAYKKQKTDNFVLHYSWNQILEQTHQVTWLKLIIVSQAVHEI